MAHRLLFVCAMNVCRSPLAAQTFTDALAADNARKGWVIKSAGIRATDGEPICPVAARMLYPGVADPVVQARHTSAPINIDKISSYDLILVASRAERGAIAKLDLHARARTFTIKEALLLGTTPVGRAEHAAAAEAVGADDDRTLKVYTAILHHRRGVVPLPAPRRPHRYLWRAGAPRDPLDHPDAHLLKDSAHDSRLRELRTDVQEIQRQMATFLAP